MVAGGGRRGSIGAAMRTGSDGGVVSQFSRALSGALGQVSFGQGLHSPEDAFGEPGAVAGMGGFAEQSGEALSQRSDAEAS